MLPVGAVSEIYGFGGMNGRWGEPVRSKISPGFQLEAMILMSGFVTEREDLVLPSVLLKDIPAWGDYTQSEVGIEETVSGALESFLATVLSWKAKKFNTIS